MVQEEKEKKIPMEFLCPKMISFRGIIEDETRVFRYVTKVMDDHHAKKEYILSFYNIGGHWVILEIM